MAQTPISASAFYNSTTPTTIYTVPASRQAVVKGILASSLVGSNNVVTVNKVSNGVTYPLVQGQITGYIASSGAYYNNPGVLSVNLLQSPITLGAGDSISISTTTTSQYKVEQAAYSANYKIYNFNYFNGYYIAVGVDNSNGIGLILTSTDGVTYTRRTFTAAVALTNVVYGNGYYVVCNATGGTIHYSTDLAAWTQVSLPSTYPCYALTYAGSKFVTGGGSGRSYYATTTPLSWTAATTFNSSNTIYTIAYIGTNYFYGTAGTSYYTSDFSSFTQPYVSTLPGTSFAGVAAANNKFIVTNQNTPGGNQNAFLRTSSDGISWSYQNTTANNLSSYYAHPSYGSNGGYMIFPYFAQGNGYYLYSSNGTSWGQTQYTGTGYSGSSNQTFSLAWENTANATYGARGLVYLNASNSHYFNGFSFNSNGTIGGQSFSFSATQLVNGSFVASPVPAFCGNPNNGSWVALMYYYNGGNYGGPTYYGSSPSTGDQSNTTGWYAAQGYGQGYGTCVGCYPNSPKYLAGSTGGWVFEATGYGQSWNQIMGNPNYVSNPAGFTHQGVPTAGMARGGESSSSPFVIVWTNGYFATTTNQGTSWTFGNLPISSIQTQMEKFNAGPIKYNNGNFIVVNNAGQAAISSDGINWSTMLVGVTNTYNLNSTNIFISSAGLYTSAAGDVNSFTNKTLTNYATNSSVNQMVYANSTYYLSSSGNLYSSSDLITWTNKSFSTQALNDIAYFGGANAGLAYSGSSTNIAISGASVANAAAGSIIGKPFTPNSSIFVGSATASVVEIS